MLLFLNLILCYKKNHPAQNILDELKETYYKEHKKNTIKPVKIGPFSAKTVDNRRNDLINSLELLILLLKTQKNKTKFMKNFIKEYENYNFDKEMFTIEDSKNIKIKKLLLRIMKIWNKAFQEKLKNTSKKKYKLLLNEQKLINNTLTEKIHLLQLEKEKFSADQNEFINKENQLKDEINEKIKIVSEKENKLKELESNVINLTVDCKNKDFVIEKINEEINLMRKSRETNLTSEEREFLSKKIESLETEQHRIKSSMAEEENSLIKNLVERIAHLENEIDELKDLKSRKKVAANISEEKIKLIVNEVSDLKELVEENSIQTKIIEEEMLANPLNEKEILIFKNLLVNLKLENKVLNEEIEKKNSTINELYEEIEKLKSENEHLKEQIKLKNKELENYKTQINYYQNEITELNINTSLKDTQIENLMLEKTSLESKFYQKNTLLEDANETIVNLTNIKDELTERIEKHIQTENALENNLNQLRGVLLENDKMLKQLEEEKQKFLTTDESELAIVKKKYEELENKCSELEKEVQSLKEENANLKRFAVIKKEDEKTSKSKQELEKEFKQQKEIRLKKQKEIKEHYDKERTDKFEADKVKLEEEMKKNVKELENKKSKSNDKSEKTNLENEIKEVKKKYEDDKLLLKNDYLRNTKEAEENYKKERVTLKAEEFDIKNYQ